MEPFFCDFTYNVDNILEISWVFVLSHTCTQNSIWIEYAAKYIEKFGLFLSEGERAVSQCS